MEQIDGKCLLSEDEFALAWSDGKWALHIPSEEKFPKGQMPAEALALTELLLQLADNHEYVHELAQAFIARGKKSS